MYWNPKTEGELPKQVRVYRNLHKKRWSVQVKTHKGWRVWRHTNEIIIKNAELDVKNAGRERVIRKKRKNVHAFVIGEPTFVRGLTLNSPIQQFQKDTPITYNPYKNAFFINKLTNEYVLNAQEILLDFPTEEGPPEVWAKL
jgi:hypothetical protein